MREVFEIIQAALTSFRQNALSLLLNALPFLVIFVVLDVVFPTHLATLPENSSSQEAIAFHSSVAINNFTKIVPYVVLFPIYLVCAHRHILTPNEIDGRFLALRLSRTEIRFVVWGAIFGFVYSATVLTVISFGSGFLFDYLFSIGAELEIVTESTRAVLYFALAIAGLVTYRFALFAPIIVAGGDKPFRYAWALSRDRNILVIASLLLVYLSQTLIARAATLIADFAPLNLFDVNLMWAVLLNLSNLLTAALAALTLSHMYLRLASEKSVNNGETSA